MLKIDELNDEIKVKDNTIESQYKDLQSKIEQIDNLMKEVENHNNKGNLVINATEQPKKLENNEEKEEDKQIKRNSPHAKDGHIINALTSVVNKPNYIQNIGKILMPKLMSTIKLENNERKQSFYTTDADVNLEDIDQTE